MKYKTMRLAAAVLFLAAAISAVSLFSNALAASEPSSYAPIAEHIELKTYLGVAISGEFQAVSSDNGDLVFAVVTQPKKGDLVVNGSSFTYTPYDGKKGSDSFTYTATDVSGNTSEPATVSIEIEKRSSKISYTDMDGHTSNYAALRLADAGVFTGEQIGGNYYFRPEQIVTRGEFLTMCLNASGTDILPNITRTGFSDDSDIPMWEKPYVSTALLAGIIRGYPTSGGSLVFSSSSPVTYAEAAVVLDSILEIADIPISGFVDEQAVPTWAYQATANLSSCDIMSGSTTGSSQLTRADAADLLCGALDLLESREEKHSLWDWVW